MLPRGFYSASELYPLSRVKCIARDPLENMPNSQQSTSKHLFLKTEKAEYHEHYKLAKCGQYKKLLLLFHLSAAWAGPQLFENDDSGVAVKSYSAIAITFSPNCPSAHHNLHKHISIGHI